MLRFALVINDYGRRDIQSFRATGRAVDERVGVGPPLYGEMRAGRRAWAIPLRFSLP